MTLFKISFIIFVLTLTPSCGKAPDALAPINTTTTADASAPAPVVQNTDGLATVAYSFGYQQICYELKRWNSAANNIVLVTKTMTQYFTRATFGNSCTLDIEAGKILSLKEG